MKHRTQIIPIGVAQTAPTVRPNRRQNGGSGRGYQTDFPSAACPWNPFWVGAQTESLHIYACADHTENARICRCGRGGMPSAS